MKIILDFLRVLKIKVLKIHLPNYWQIDNFCTKEESPHFWFRGLFDRSHFLPLILLIFREKVDFGSKFRVANVYILLESYLDNNQPVK